MISSRYHDTGGASGLNYFPVHDYEIAIFRDQIFCIKSQHERKGVILGLRASNAVNLF